MHGVVAAGDLRTAQAGATMFGQGGNAVDAAVAAAFASFVVECCVVTIGGGGFAMVAEPPNRGKTPYNSFVAYDFFTNMPSTPLLNPLGFHAIHINFGIETQEFFIGRGSSAVPGVVSGLCQMLLEKGQLSLKTVLEPAIHLARNGFAVNEMMAFIFSLLEPIYSDTPEINAVYQPGYYSKHIGHTLKLPQLARTLEELAIHGPQLFYNGILAQKIAADHASHGGLISLRDLNNYRTHTIAPIIVTYRDYEVLLTPPSSLGGVLIGFALKLLDTIPLHQIHYHSVEHIKILAYIMMLTNNARRAWHLAEGNNKEKIEYFLGEPHITSYREKLEHLLKNGGALDEPYPKSGLGHTSHISVIDDEGRAVSLTTSAGEGAGYLIEDTGINLNNMLGEHDLHPHGFHKDPPGQRLHSMMSPVIILKNHRPVLALGSAGSNRLRSAILQTISNAIDFKLHVKDSVNLPRIHFESNVLQIEGGFSPDVIAELKNLGFKVNSWDGLSLFFGGAQATSFWNSRLEGGADPRRCGDIARK